MKNFLMIVSFILAAGLVFGAMPRHEAHLMRGPVIHFDEMVHDFGTMKEGDVVNYVFKFTNSGNEPLIIEDVEQPCGCTIPSWSKEPIMPGKTGEVKVIFNSKERPGVFRKTLAIKTNAPAKVNDPLMLMIKGNVLTKKQWKLKATAGTK